MTTRRKRERREALAQLRSTPMQFGNGRFDIPQKTELFVTPLPGDLAGPVAVLKQAAGKTEVGIIGGLTKIEVYILHLCATVPSGEWDADPRAAAHKVLTRFQALQQVLHTPTPADPSASAAQGSSPDGQTATPEKPGGESTTPGGIVLP